MLEVLFVWVLFGLVSVFWGEKFCALVSRQFVPEYETNLWISFWVGLVLLSIFLGLFSFVFPFLPVVKLILWLTLLLPIVISFSWSKRFANSFFLQLKTIGLPALALVLLGFGIALLKSIGDPEIFDEGAYHLPLIRMWENQGLVPGIANLNGHYGLNSSWHILNAFSNFTFLPGWKLAICLNGLLLVVLSGYAGLSLSHILKGKAISSDWIVLFLPFFVFRNLLSSPSTDIPAIICTWFIFTLWYRNIEYQDSPWKIWPILGLIPFWVVMIKASSSALLIIPVGFFALACFEKTSWSKPLLILVFGAVLLFPWIIQNWLLTGYGVFPIKITALGTPEWQVPIESINRKFYLEQFGKFAPPKEFTWVWFVDWFRAHNKDTQIILVLVLSSLVFVGVALIRKTAERVWSKVFLYITIISCLTSWFVTITEPRYGFGALVFSALFPIASFLFFLSRQFSILRFAAMSILALQSFNMYKTWSEAEFFASRLFIPASRPVLEYRTLHCGNFSGVSPVSYKTQVPKEKPPFCWDCPFPCIPKESSADSSFIFQIQVLGKSGFSFRNPK